MKKSQIVMFLMLLVVIPATLLLGMKLPGRSYYLLSAVVAIEILIPFFMAFEGRRPQPRELVTVAVMSALVTIARVAVPLPSFKPTFAVIMLAGIAFGPETGFIVGALGALGSDFFYGQGPFTPWQMMAYGMAGLLAGFVFQRNWLPRKNWVMGVFCFVCTVLFIGPLLDTSTVTIIATKFTWENMLPIYASGLPVNVSQGACSFLTMLLFGNAILEKLERVKTQYGMMETGDDGI
jgi:energy-coupling factor transport system substrate-specific component